MSNWRSIVGSAVASWIALTVAAIAQSKDDRQLPTGDVWITPEHPYLFASSSTQGKDAHCGDGPRGCLGGP
jgi:hypothetical protein